MFAAFISNELDPLRAFDDGAFHQSCFSRHPFATEVRRRFEERFTARRMAEDYVRIYESAIKAGRRRPENGIGALRASAE